MGGQKLSDKDTLPHNRRYAWLVAKLISGAETSTAPDTTGLVGSIQAPMIRPWSLVFCRSKASQITGRCLATLGRRVIKPLITA